MPQAAVGLLGGIGGAATGLLSGAGGLLSGAGGMLSGGLGMLTGGAGGGGGGMSGVMGMVSKGLGTFMNYKTGKQETKTEAAWHAYSAVMHNRNVEYMKLASNEMQRSRRELLRKNLSTMRTSYAKAGVTIEGSPMDVMLEKIDYAEKDIATKYYDIEVGIQKEKSLAAIQRWQEAEVKRTGKLSSQATLFGGISGMLMPGIESMLGSKGMI